MDNLKAEVFMRRAIELAQLAKEKDQGPFGAVIVRGDEIIAEVHNVVKSQTDPTQHAELRAIQDACKKLNTIDLSDCKLFTSCEPCMMCLGTCYWVNFETIYFGVSAENAKKFGFVYSDMYYSRHPEKRKEEFRMKQLLENEALEVFTN